MKIFAVVDENEMSGAHNALYYSTREAAERAAAQLREDSTEEENEINPVEVIEIEVIEGGI